MQLSCILALGRATLFAMGRGGSNRLPRKTKALRGTLEKSREPKPVPAPPAPPASLAEPPAAFTAREKVIWAELAPQVEPTFTTRDRSGFEMLVRLRARMDDPKLPAHAFCSLAKTVVGLLERFGCVPSARERVPLVKPADEIDESERFLFGPPAFPPKLEH